MNSNSARLQTCKVRPTLSETKPQIQSPFQNTACLSMLARQRRHKLRSWESSYISSNSKPSSASPSSISPTRWYFTDAQFRQNAYRAIYHAHTGHVNLQRCTLSSPFMTLHLSIPSFRVQILPNKLSTISSAAHHTPFSSPMTLYPSMSRNIPTFTILPRAQPPIPIQLFPLYMTLPQHPANTAAPIACPVPSYTLLRREISNHPDPQHVQPLKPPSFAM